MRPISAINLDQDRADIRNSIRYHSIACLGIQQKTGPQVGNEHGSVLDWIVTSIVKTPFQFCVQLLSATDLQPSQGARCCGQLLKLLERTCLWCPQQQRMLLMVHLTFLTAGSVACALHLCWGFLQSPAARIHNVRHDYFWQNTSKAGG